MPFINERLTQQHENIEREKYEKKPERASRFRFDPNKVMATLSSRIVGQAHVLRAMEDMLFTVKADFNSTQRPLCINLFLGPTGVGKTETVRVIAEAILGSTEKICRIDMNTLAQEHYTAALTGSPPGYVGSKEGQTLFNIDNIKGSFSEPGIVLFDEIEKANKDVVRAILNVLDTGKLVLTSGVKEIDFSNALIFMTSNIGARDVTEYTAKFKRGWRYWFGLKPHHEANILEDALTRHFDPEFLNRIDQIIPFQRLHNEVLDNLITIELEKLNKRISRRGASLQFSESVRQYLCEDYDERYGARNLSRRMRKELEPTLARALVNLPNEARFIAHIQDKKIVVCPSTPSS